MVATSTRLRAAEDGMRSRVSPRVFVGVTVLLFALVAAYVLWLGVKHGRDEARRDAETATATHDGSRTEQLIDKLFDVMFYNTYQASLGESFPLTMRVEPNPASATVTGCRPPARLQFKARMLAPTFDAQNSLDDIVSASAGVQWFSWMMTPREHGLQDVRVRGIVYCLSPQGAVTMRQTVVDQIRAIVVTQPFAFSPDNWVSLVAAACALIGSGGILTAFLGLFHRTEGKRTGAD